MQMPKALWFMMTALLPLAALSGGCAVTIKDFQFCSPVPGSLGAVCDNFLTASQQILTEAEWQVLQASWVTAGQAVECTTSQTVGDLKAELEKLCSKTPCTYQEAKAVKTAISSLKRMMDTGVASRSLMIQ